MKLAWICYKFDDEPPIIVFDEPLYMRYIKVVPIVYAEIQNQ